MYTLGRELRFLAALWQANLLAAMEYRMAFLTQVVGMMLNNTLYFAFWVLFFDRFQEVRGWQLQDMLLLFAVVAVSFGLASVLFGNAMSLGEVIAQGRLDYYLSLPRPVLLHVLASSSILSGVGDVLYGLVSFVLAGEYSLGAMGRFVLGSLLAVVIFLSVLVLAHSSAFWLGNAGLLAHQVLNAMITFAIYPITLFDGVAKLLLFTLLPAALLGAVPAELVRAFSWSHFVQLVSASVIFLGLAWLLFHRGLRHYESGSAIQTQR